MATIHTEATSQEDHKIFHLQTDKPVNQFLWTKCPLQDTVIALVTEHGHGLPEALSSLITRADPQKQFSF
jgi:hypothetical protein